MFIIVETQIIPIARGSLDSMWAEFNISTWPSSSSSVCFDEFSEKWNKNVEIIFSCSNLFAAEGRASLIWD